MGVSLLEELPEFHYKRAKHWKKNSVVVITQDSVRDDILKRKIKN